MSYNATRYEEVMTYNGNGEMTGPVITSSLVDNLGYGYIGINASTVNINDEWGSEASKNLCKAFATVWLFIAMSRLTLLRRSCRSYPLPDFQHLLGCTTTH